MAAAGGSRRTWAADVEKTLKEAVKTVEVSRWERHCIYRVPACIKDIKTKAYQPQVVSLGPFHHGDPNLLPMEDHKRRALRHLLQRAGRPLDEFVLAVEDAAEQLESAYMDLGGEWRSGVGVVTGGRERFVEMMIVDGCFLLEVMRTAAGKHVDDYALNDPIFSRHGVLYMTPYIRRDMLMLENQLPLLVLKRLVAVEWAKSPNDEFINRMVLRFLAPPSQPPAPSNGLGLHPLDVFRRSMLFGPHQAAWRTEDTPDSDNIPSAVGLYEAGIRFKTSKTSSLHDIHFQHGVLSMPKVPVDDSTEYMFLNIMAFEKLHVGAGNDVTTYVFFMNNIIQSAKDVALLSSKGIIQNAFGCHKAVAKLFNSMTRDAVLEPESTLDAVQRQVNGYFKQPWNMWRANLIHTYFRSPWPFLCLAAFFLLVMTTVQTVYIVLPFYRGSNS